MEITPTPELWGGSKRGRTRVELIAYREDIRKAVYKWRRSLDIPLNGIVWENLDDEETIVFLNTLGDISAAIKDLCVVAHVPFNSSWAESFRTYLISNQIQVPGTPVKEWQVDDIKYTDTSGATASFDLGWIAEDGDQKLSAVFYSYPTTDEWKFFQLSVKDELLKNKTNIRSNWQGLPLDKIVTICDARRQGVKNKDIPGHIQQKYGWGVHYSEDDIKHILDDGRKLGFLVA